MNIRGGDIAAHPSPKDVPMPAIRPRAGLPLNHHLITASRRSSMDSDDASSIASSDYGYGSPPRARSGGGLAPPPTRKTSKTTARMPPIPGSPTEETEDGMYGISPILSRAPPPSNRSLAGSYPPPPPPPPPPLTMSEKASSPSDDVIPDEHKRIPGLIPRSPLSPMRGFMARRARKHAVPPPIVIQSSSSSGNFDLEKGGGVVTTGLESVAIQSPATTAVQPAAKPKRKTVWGFVDGWWELGLLERMNTVRRKR
ncbi:hypothetical protein B0T17DRAFT_621289 [Bombardia bombarda]|uniref:Uncharacterized protein n=1 Tax=Bombardia bombarda TaxID=252184 RepID=A0AA39TLZ7_9PEZI|nr:hypothetical protein B0T17DRAFT_621289 [Bombardia bombarda]